MWIFHWTELPCKEFLSKEQLEQFQHNYTYDSVSSSECELAHTDSRSLNSCRLTKENLLLSFHLRNLDQKRRWKCPHIVLYFIKYPGFWSNGLHLKTSTKEKKHADHGNVTQVILICGMQVQFYSLVPGMSNISVTSATVCTL